MRSILGSTGKTFYFQGPVQINYGSHTFIGENFFANFGLTIMDDARVYIGNNVCFGPNVSLMATTHPLIAQERMGMDAEGRTTMAEYADEIHIGNNVVIGAGSVVTKDIPDGYLAFGNPCKPVRPITEADSKKDLILPEDRKHFEYNLM